jgi:hypothetical protein
MVLLERTGLVQRGCWAATGPTDATSAVVVGGAGVSSGERLLIQVCMDLWNGEGGAAFSKILSVCDGGNLRLLGSLLIALSDPRGSLAIDEWLESLRRNDWTLGECLRRKK